MRKASIWYPVIISTTTAAALSGFVKFLLNHDVSYGVTCLVFLLIATVASIRYFFYLRRR